MGVINTTKFTVGEINTLVAVLSVVARYIMAFIIGKIILDIRRIMVSKGNGDAIIQDAGYLSEVTDIPKLIGVCKRSKTRYMTVLACLPIIIGIMTSFLLEFTTSGIKSTILKVEDPEDQDGIVYVYGLVGRDYQGDVVIPSIQDVNENADVMSYADFYEPSPEDTLSNSDVFMFSPGMNTLGLELGDGIQSSMTVTNSYVSEGGMGFFVYKNQYTIGTQVSYGFCVEFDPYDSTLVSCREDLTFEKTYRDITIEAIYLAYYEENSETSCEVLYDELYLGSGSFQVVNRVFAIDNTGTDRWQGEATCVSLGDGGKWSDASDVEVCVWVDPDDGTITAGQWSPGEYAGNCFGDTDQDLDMAYVRFVYDPLYGLESLTQGGDALIILATRIFEELSGYSPLDSDSVVTGVISALLRVESLAIGLIESNTSIDIEEVSVDAWVIVVLVMVIVGPLFTLFFIRRLRGDDFFLPVSIEEWNACMARELDRSVPHDLYEKPGPEYFDAVYAFGNTDRYTGKGPRLGWVKKDDVTSSVVEIQ